MVITNARTTGEYLSRMFVTDMARWEEFGRAHHEFFADFPPSTTMVEVKSLIDPQMLIEIEADAVCQTRADAGQDPEGKQ